ncbi:hypothetical protein BU15DRAFT_68154 [Melanogaster broomeanus]|nr:hypothetical protein BU15DRAFT_68154 [Melanogaster broomeanus]
MSSPRLRVPIAPTHVSHLPDAERDACGWDLVGPLTPVLQPNPIHPTLQRFSEQTETVAMICTSDCKTQEDGPWDTTCRQPLCNWQLHGSSFPTIASAAPHHLFTEIPRVLTPWPSSLSPATQGLNVSCQPEHVVSESSLRVFPCLLAFSVGLSHTRTRCPSPCLIQTSPHVPIIPDAPRAAAADGAVSVHGTFVYGMRWFRRDMIR